MTKRIVCLAVALLAPAWLSVEAFQQQKPTAVLTGTLLSDDGRPVDRAMVSIVGTDKPGVRATETNASGEFSFDGLPAGSFAIWAAKDGFLTSYYGSKDPGRGPAIPVTLMNGQRVAVKMTMHRGAAITGKITDVAGEPLSQVLVQLRSVTSPKVVEPQTSKTDSDGDYLIFGLAPGEYIVEAVSRLADGSALAYAPTFFPSVSVIDQAEKITVNAGERRDDVTFSLYRAARVSGKVIVPIGAAMTGVRIALVPTDPIADAAIGVGSVGVLRAPVSDTGEFSIPGAVPGTYALWARWDANSSARPLVPDASTLWGMNTIVVNGPNVSGVILNLQPGVRVSGSIRINTAAETPAMETLRLTLSPQTSSTATFAGGFVANPNPSGIFVFPSVPPGLYDLRTAPREVTGSPVDTWVITSAIASGHDVADGPLDIRPGGTTGDVIVTLTDTEISGTVVDAGSQPTARFPLLFFSVDRTFWTPRSRRVRTAQPAADGTFRVGGLPPGDYFVVAQPHVDVDVDLPVDAVALDQFAGVASRITIASGEKRRFDLTLSSAPDSGGVARGRTDFLGTWTGGVVGGAIEGRGNSPAGQLHVGPGTGKLVISARGDGLRIKSDYSLFGNHTFGNHTVEYGLNGERVRNSFFLGTTLPSSPTPPAEVTSWRQGNNLVSTIDVFLPGESVPLHYVETLSISAEGILAVRIERVGFPDARTLLYRRAK
jgi:hypothetical protein